MLPSVASVKGLDFKFPITSFCTDDKRHLNKDIVFECPQLFAATFESRNIF